MLEDQINKLADLMQDEDLKKYAGDGFWDLMQAVIFSDPAAAVGAARNAIEIAVHMPTYLFWNNNEALPDRHLSLLRRSGQDGR